MLFLYFALRFFFKQKTAYELRISDWSSDVCSSDLRLAGQPLCQRTPCLAHHRLPRCRPNLYPAGNREQSPPVAAHRARCVAACEKAVIGVIDELFCEHRPELLPREDRKSTRLNSSH